MKKFIAVGILVTLSACALFTKTVSVLTPASAALVSCLDDYVDVPQNPIDILKASISCGATIATIVPVLEADLAESIDAGTVTTDAAVVVSHVYVQPSARHTRLAALYADAKAKGYTK